MIGQTIGNYQIIEQIGMGGMATVYKAYEPGVERYVALKVLPERYAQEHDFVERFKREARTIARLEHKHILPVYAFGEDGGITYLAMRYLPGGTLKELGASGRLDLSEIARLIEQICSALDYAHRQGVIHRDVKPSNILISAEGDAYLMDFGIAKVLEGVSELTATGAMIGTPAYMAPEQAMAQEIDHRADIYAVGVILYELAVGKPPYQADTPMAVLLQHIQDPLPLPRNVNPDIPERVQEVIIKALAKDREDRYAKANDLAAALNTALQGLETVVKKGTTLELLLSDMEETRQAASMPPPVPPYYGEEAETIPDRHPSPGRRIPWALIGGAGLLVAVVAVVGILMSLGVFGSRDSGQTVTGSGGQEQPAASGEEIGASPEDSGDFVEQPGMFDTFSNPAYDGRFNNQLWYTYGGVSCSYSQEDGHMSIVRQDRDMGDECGLAVKTGVSSPTGGDIAYAAGRFRINSDIEPPVEANLGYWFEFPEGSYYVICGLAAGNPESPELGFLFDVVDPRLGRSVYTENISNLNFDTWYSARLEVDPLTMAFDCYADDALVGSYTPENARELRESPVNLRLFHTWHPKGSMATVLADDFEVDYSDYAAFNVYDDFDDPAYDGSYNSNLWSHPEEACVPTQTDGVMSFSFDTTTTGAGGLGCSLIASPGTLPPLGSDLQSMLLRMQIPGDRDPHFIGVNAQYLTQFVSGGYYSITCGIHGWQPTEMGIALEGTDGRLPDSEAQTYWQSFPVIQHDRWYTVNLQVDPATMTFSCKLDGETVGTFTPENAEELANQRWEYQVFAWRDRGTATNIRALVDDFYFIPTGQ